MPKLAIITGSSRGLGRQIAQDFLDVGYSVVGISRGPSHPSFSSTGLYHHVRADLGDTKAIYALVRGIVKEHGVPESLILNGALGIGRPLGIMHESEISSLLKVNLEANILLVKYVSRQMISRRKGAILFVSSIAASDGFANLSVYGATKSALDSLASSLSREFSGRGVRVMSISPGFMATEMTGGYSENELDKIKRRTLNSNLVGTRDVSRVALFLCSESASGLNGITLRVENGEV